MGDLCSQTPLIELARRVPIDLRAQWEIQWFDDGTPCGHAMSPVGQHLHDMADEIERLQARVETLEGVLAHIATKPPPDDAYELRLLARRALGGESDDCGYSVEDRQ